LKYPKTLDKDKNKSSASAELFCCKIEYMSYFLYTNSFKKVCGSIKNSLEKVHE
jgi:hypothetical protein